MDNKKIPASLVGRRSDVNIHLQELQHEFLETPEICFKLISCIVYIRRNINQKEQLILFNHLLIEHKKECLYHLSTRWLVSICDTLADHGSAVEKANAMIVSTFVNLIKLSDTYVNLLEVPAISKANLQQQKAGIPLWDGLTEFSVKDGDMMRNLFNRIENSVSEAPLIQDIWHEILRKIKSNHCLVSNIAELHIQQRFYK